MTTLIIILLTIVALGIIWVVVKNILDKGSDEITLTGLTLDLEITKVVVDETFVNVTVKRNPGDGNLVGINFVFSDGDNSVVVRRDTTLAELGVQTFSFIQLQLAVGEITSISIAPIFETSSGKETIGEVKDTTTSSSGDLGTGDTGYTGPPGGEETCSPACLFPEECIGGVCVTECVPELTCITEGFDCETFIDDCSDPVDCGTCEGTDICTSNICVPDDCVPLSDELICSEFNCGIINNASTCGLDVNCSVVAGGTCVEQHPGEPNWECVDNICIQGTYVEGGLIDNVWPPGAGIYFDDDALTKIDNLYYGYPVAFSGYDSECYLIVGYSYDEAVYANVIIEMFLQEPLVDLQAGDSYEIWDQINECTNALPVGD